MTGRRLSDWQAAAIVLISSGLGVMVPSESFSGTALASRLLCIALLFAPIFFFLRLMSRSESGSFDGAMSSLLPKPAASAVFMLTGAYFVIQASLRLANGCKLINLFLLPQTPREAVLLLITACAPVLCFSGLRRLGALGELVCLLLVLPVVFLIVMGVSHIDRVKLMELSLSKGIRPSETAEAARSFHGVGALVFCAGSERLSVKGHKNLLYAYLAASLFSLTAFFVCAGMFSVKGAQALIYPINEAFRVLSIGTLELSERYDLLLLIVQLVSVIMGTAILVYCAASSLSAGLSLKSHRGLVLPILPVVLALSFAMSHGHLMFMQTLGEIGFLALVLVLLPGVCVLLRIKEGRS